MERRLHACIGVVSGPITAWDPVNQPMIRHWCDAMGDRNPLYTDPELAAKSRYGGVIAPATMIQAWTMPGYTGQLPPGSVPTPEGQDDAYDLLTAGGYISVVAVNCEQRYFAVLKPGDQIRHTSMLESVSGKKQTALGEGYFMTNLLCFYNQRDEKVCDMRFRLLRFRPPAGQPGADNESGD